MGITDPNQEYFKDGGWGWNGTAWVKGGVPFAYTERWAEDLSSAKVGDGTWSAGTTAVPAGYVYVAQFFYFRNNSGVRGNRYVYFLDGAATYFAVYSITPARWIPDIWSGGVPLCAGDSIQFAHLLCLNGDSVQAGVWGYKMKVT